MLAIRDQENAIHHQQAVAAAKPANQSVKQLPPKTPGNKNAKTPFKVPLNDENGAGLGAVKTVLGRANENTVIGKKKAGSPENNAFVTPLVTRPRAPLGAKTTNAKAKPIQIPVLAPKGNDVGKTSQKSVSARKPKPRVVHPESTKLEDILADKEALGEREIEYMPPKPTDLPDHPDDLPELDLSILRPENEIPDLLHYFSNKPDEEGLSYVQRREMKQQKAIDLAQKKVEAKTQLRIDSGPFPCYCYPGCLGSECVQSVARRKEAEETYKKTLAALEPKPDPHSKKPLLNKGPTIGTSKAAVAALSQSKRPAPASKTASQSTASARKPMSSVPRGKKTPPPTNPSSMRHTAASAASRTTMGYSKGRAASATMRKLGKDFRNEAEVDPHELSLQEFIQRYGIPKVGSDKWVECKRAGCFDEGDDDVLGDEIAARDRLADMIREEAQQEFVLEF